MPNSDIQDAIIYAQSLPEIDPNKIGVWGASYSGGHVLYLAATDSRIKAVIAETPLVNCWEQFHHLMRPDIAQDYLQPFKQTASQEQRVSQLEQYQSSVRTRLTKV